MAWRICSFLLCQAVAGLGWLVGVARVQVGLVAGRTGLVRVVPFPAGAALAEAGCAAARARPADLAGWWGEAASACGARCGRASSRPRTPKRRLQEFLAAIQASPNGVVLLDAHGRIEWCNETAADHLGIDPSRDLQQLIGNLLRDPAFAPSTARRATSRATSSSRAATARRAARAACRCTCTPTAKGRKLLLSRDVTALEQAEAMRRDFVANVSHEIRTPLTVLAGFIETLQNLPLPAGPRALPGLMAQQARAHADAGERPADAVAPGRQSLARRGRVDAVAALLAQCEQEARSLSPRWASRWSCRSSRRRMTRWPARRVRTAQRHVQPGEQRGALHAVGRPVVVRLAGAGRRQGRVLGARHRPRHRAEHLPRLTERFYRVDRSRSRETAAPGLGLAIVKHVVQRHGGELRIESTPGAGSVFAIVLPAGRVRRGQADAAGATAQPATAGCR
jgi:two-component system phosphate regulon sensor histidine kinase PhoR